MWYNLPITEMGEEEHPRQDTESLNRGIKALDTKTS